MMKTVYERMASSPLKCVNQLTTGDAPHRSFVAQFVYENGLVVNYDGSERGMQVVREERKDERA